MPSMVRDSGEEGNSGRPFAQSPSSSSPKRKTESEESTVPSSLHVNRPRPIRWKKGEIIGSGAYGRVYMGMNLDNGELIAVKQVRGERKVEKNLKIENRK